MNQLSIEKRAKILQLLVEGSSLRSISRICDCSINTVTRQLVLAGQACLDYHDKKVKGVKSKRVQCDEVWSYVYSKQKNVPTGMEDNAGDVWTWTGIDADTKLVVSYFVGNRDGECANWFMHDLKSRLANAVQLTTDGHKAYLEAVESAFEGAIDYAMLIKLYGQPMGENPTERKYSPAECIGFEIKKIAGNPNPIYTSTSYVERQNLTMRMHMRRFTRLTNAFSKKLENHVYSIALYFVYYNFAKIHKTLRVTPAMEAGLIDHWLEFEDIVKLTDEFHNNSN